MKIRKVLTYAILLGGIALVAFIYFALPIFIQESITAFLSEKGFYEISIKAQRPKLHLASLPSFKASYQIGTSKYSINAEDITVFYNWREPQSFIEKVHLKDAKLYLNDELVSTAYLELLEPLSINFVNSYTTWKTNSPKLKLSVPKFTLNDISIANENILGSLEASSDIDKGLSIASKLKISDLEINSPNFQFQSDNLDTDITYEHPLQVKDSVPLAMNIAFEKAQASIKETPFSNISAQLSLVGLKDIHTKKAALVKVAKIDPGVAFNEIESLLQFRRDPISGAIQFELSDLNAKLLDGKVYSKRIPFEIPVAKTSFAVQLEKLSVKKIVELEKQDSISASGFISGTLPIELSPKGLRIKDGKITSLAPGGVIRYSIDKETESISTANPNMQIVFKALENYHYQNLNIKTSYKTDGTLLLNMQLKGKNPAYNMGQEINFNINLEENIPALLKSLKVAQGLNERVRSRFENMR